MFLLGMCGSCLSGFLANKPWRNKTIQTKRSNKHWMKFKAFITFWTEHLLFHVWFFSLICTDTNEATGRNTWANLYREVFRPDMQKLALLKWHCTCSIVQYFHAFIMIYSLFTQHILTFKLSWCQLSMYCLVPWLRCFNQRRNKGRSVSLPLPIRYNHTVCVCVHACAPKWVLKQSMKTAVLNFWLMQNT